MTRVALLVAFGAVTSGALGGCSDPSSAPSDPGVTALALAASRSKGCTLPPPDSDIPLPIAPRSQRVDLAPPLFSRPTNVINPLFPIARLSQVILVGAADGEPFRTETTLLPTTNPIRIGNRVVETLTSQYVAYLDRRIHEVALDWYAQADDGSVWYLGEDVFNYEDGEIADTEGTWLACRDGPAAMIMPAHPRVGDVYRPENVFPVVFEEVTVKSVGQVVDGPLGPVAGAIVVEELHMDGTTEDKIFAPGYGEFSTGSGDNVEALALAIPTDAAPGPTPDALRALLSGADDVFRDARSNDWWDASRAVRAMSAAWRRYRAAGVPRLLEPLMTEALEELAQAVAAREETESRQAALDVTRNGLDLLLRYRSRIDVDVARLDLWTRQLVIDAEARNAAGVASDIAILKWVLARLANTGDRRDAEAVRRVRHELGAIQSALEKGDFSAILRAARHLQELLQEGGDEESSE